MERRRVRTIDEIIFEQGEERVVLPKALELAVETVLEGGIILCSDEGERMMIDLETFENCFEAVG